MRLGSWSVVCSATQIQQWMNAGSATGQEIAIELESLASLPSFFEVFTSRMNYRVRENWAAILEPFDHLSPNLASSSTFSVR